MISAHSCFSYLLSRNVPVKKIITEANEMTET